MSGAVFNVLTERLSHLELCMAEAKEEKKAIDAKIGEMSAEYKEIAQFIQNYKEEPQMSANEAKKSTRRGTKHNSSIDKEQAEAKALGISYGQLQELKRNQEEIKKNVKEGGKWIP